MNIIRYMDFIFMVNRQTSNAIVSFDMLLINKITVLRWMKLAGDKINSAEAVGLLV